MPWFDVVLKGFVLIEYIIMGYHFLAEIAFKSQFRGRKLKYNIPHSIEVFLVARTMLNNSLLIKGKNM